MKNLLLFPLRLCTHFLHRFFDLLISAMRLSALNWLRIGRRAADAGLDVADSAREHGAALKRRILPHEKK
jgi:hypothetical protein